MPHSGIFAFFYITGKEEGPSMQELIEHRDSINRQLARYGKRQGSAAQSRFACLCAGGRKDNGMAQRPDAVQP